MLGAMSARGSDVLSAASLWRDDRLRLRNEKAGFVVEAFGEGRHDGGEEGGESISPPFATGRSEESSRPAGGGLEGTVEEDG